MQYRTWFVNDATITWNLRRCCTTRENSDSRMARLVGQETLLEALKNIFCSSSAHECTLVLAYSFRLLYFYCERGLLSSSAHDCLTLMEDIDSEDDVSLYHGLRIRRVTVAVSNVVCQRCNYNVKFETLLYNTREFGFAHGENCRTRNASRSFEKHFFYIFF